MKIIYILPVNMLDYGYTLNDFIGTHFSVQIAKEVAKRGHQVELHVFWNMNLVDRQANFTIFFHRCSFKKLFKHNFAQLSFNLLRDKMECDVIHFHEPNRLFFVLFRLAHLKHNIIIEHHGTGISNPFAKRSLLYPLYGSVRKFLLPLLMQSCAYYIVHNRKAVSDASQYTTKKRIILSPNGINPHDWKIYNKQASRKVLKLGNETIFLFVGRINKDKGIPELISAFEKIKYKDKRLFLVGPLEDRNLEKIVKPYWIGFKQGRELHQLYSAVDVFCLPTHFEAFGLVLLEALYYNLPLIASDLPELREVAPIKNTAFIKIGDVHDIHTNMVKTLDSSIRLAMSRGGRDYVLSSFTWEIVCKRYSELYEISVKK